MAIPKAIVVIGASEGGVEALRTIVSDLPKNFDAALFVTLHIGAHKSDLPWLLNQAGPLTATHPKHGEEIAAGRIYVAPPDHHMMIESGRIKLSKGPRENWTRPAIDPLFRSAAAAYGARVIGVILTGGLNDGTAGLYEIKQQGGTTVVQDPADATNPSMPRSALVNVSVDHVLPVAGIGQLLEDLIAVKTPPSLPTTRVGRTDEAQADEMDAEFTLDRPIAVTCPDCGGALRQSQLGRLTQFSCHIGHVYTADVMLAAQFLAMERFLEQAMRSLSERAELCRLMSEKESVPAEGVDCAPWKEARQEALEQTQPLRDLLTREWIHPRSSLELRRS